jgi:regulator of ribonuclease activity A
MLATPGEGRVLVIDGGGSLRCALLGDQLAQLAVDNGWSGVVVWGCIRDAATIAGMDLGVFALATHPQKTVKKNLGEVGVPVCFAGVEFRPGDWLYADTDGLIVAAERLH